MATPVEAVPVFVDREDELATLVDAVTRASQGNGSTVFIEGDPGMGKGTLVRTLRDKAAHLTPPVQAEFAIGHCYVDLGANSPYQPFAEILGTLATSKRSVGELAMKIIQDVGPDLLDIIPGIGPAAKVVVKTGVTAAQWLVDADQKSALATVLADQYVRSLTTIADKFSPLVIVIEDAQWIDGPTCQVLLRLAQSCASEHLVLIVTYRPSYVQKGSPFDSVLSETRIDNLAKVISLRGLNEQSVRDYVQLRYGAELNPNLAAWLVQVCGGNPFFISQLLSVLEERQIIHRTPDGSFVFDGEVTDTLGLGGNLALLPIPSTIEAVLDQRIAHVLETDVPMLEVGSVQGQLFFSSVLGRVLSVEVIPLLQSLQRIAGDDRLINIVDGTAWDENSDVYTFDNILTQQAFYRRLSPQQLRIYHAGIGDALDALVTASVQPSRMLILQTAFQFESGRRPSLAAAYYQRAAESAFGDGALRETIELCKRALDQIRTLAAPGPPEQCRLHADIIRLLLLASRIQWIGKTELQGDMPLLQLADEGLAAAAAAQDLSIQAQIKYLKGMIMLISAGLAQSLGPLKEAIDLAHQAGDDVGEFTVTAEYGHHLVGENLQDGLQTLQHALDLYTMKVAPRFSGPLPLAVEANALKLKGFLGVGQFDNGNFDVARQLLEESVAGLERLKRDADLPLFYSFAGQLYTATGRFESAEDIYSKALADLKTSPAPNAWRGYHLGLLGKLYLEWNRPLDADKPLRDGWDETQKSWQVDLVPIVRNYFAEFLMRPPLPSTDLSRAGQLLDTTIAETKQSGFHRSEIGALSLRGRLALMNAEIPVAIDYSNQAVTLLQQLGTMPALRSEEVWFAHYTILHAAGREAEAQTFLQLARSVVDAKAQSLPDDLSRQTFRERVRLNRAIVEGDPQFGAVTGQGGSQ